MKISSESKVVLFQYGEEFFDAYVDVIFVSEDMHASVEDVEIRYVEDMDGNILTDIPPDMEEIIVWKAKNGEYVNG